MPRDYSPDAPRHQHYRNPLKGGWYYVDAGDHPISGLMSKREARRFIRRRAINVGGLYCYGIAIVRVADCPRGFWRKLFTRPKISG